MLQLKTSRASLRLHVRNVPCALCRPACDLAALGNSQAASDKELPYVLLRRTADYEVRRYPVHVSIATSYEKRIDGFGTLGAYTNGANEEEREFVVRCCPGELRRSGSVESGSCTRQGVLGWVFL